MSKFSQNLKLDSKLFADPGVRKQAYIKSIITK